MTQSSKKARSSGNAVEPISSTILQGLLWIARDLSNELKLHNAALAGEVPAMPEQPQSKDQLIGESTGLYHETATRIDEAALWFAVNRDRCERPVVVALARRFGLKPAEAVAAIAQANAILANCVRM